MARSSNANLAAKIANAVADAYIGKHRQWKVEAARHASDWLQTRLQTLSEQSSAAEKAVLNFKAANNIVAASGKLLNDQQLSDLNTQLAGARTGAASAQARLNRIEAVLGAREPTSGVAATVTDALNNPIITRLRTQYLELASRQADYAARFGANHEAVVNLRKQVADLQASMRSELGRIAETYKSEYVIAIERQKELEKRVAEQIADSQQVNKAEITLRQLESTARNYRTLHDMFLQRYGESQQSVVTDEARVISPASSPGAPSSPKPLLVGALTILGGLAAGAALGLLRELLDNVFRTGESVPAAIGTECLAVVPALKSERGSLLRVVGANADARRVYPPILRRRSRRGGAAFRSGGETTYVHFAEAIGAIRLALSFNKKAMDDKIIGITSSLPGEGKSTIAASLARAVAETGARTILVDADLRKPTLSRSLVPNAKCGLMEVIQGTSALDNAIWTDPDTKLDFLPYIGSTPATPVIDIFSTTTIEQIFERLRAEYEYVFVDLCPLLPVIDVRSTTDLCDAYLFVVEWGRTDINLVKHSLSTAPRVWEKLAGAVLNRADFSRLAKFGRGASTYDSEYLRTYRDRELAPIGQLVPAPKGRISAMRRIEEQTS
jgi:succinoglycan biosynthesis transport protein ExoP